MNAQKPPPATSAAGPNAPRPPVAKPPLDPRASFAASLRGPRATPRASQTPSTSDRRPAPPAASSAAPPPPPRPAPLAEPLAHPPAPRAATGDYEPRTRPRSHGDAHDPLDPLLRQPAFQPPTPASSPLDPQAREAAVLSRASASLEELLPALVRKIAWSGDGKRGAVRMELGAGALAGATLLLESDEGRVRVHLSAPPGIDAGEWRDRIGQRLAARRIEVESIEVE